MPCEEGQGYKANLTGSISNKNLAVTLFESLVGNLKIKSKATIEFIKSDGETNGVLVYDVLKTEII